MNKFYYFAVIRFEETVMAGSERTKRVPVAHYGKPYSSAKEAVEANLQWMCNHIGERFSVCCFDKQLKLDENGVAHGF